MTARSVKPSRRPILGEVSEGAPFSISGPPPVIYSRERAGGRLAPGLTGVAPPGSGVGA